MTSRERREDPRWQICFFRGLDDEIPARSFLQGIPAKAAAEIEAVLAAVAAAPPPAFSGGGKWEVMHGEMRGFYEIRVRHSRSLFRLICILERKADDLGGPAIICLDGLAKPSGSPADPADYRRIKRLADEFRRSRNVQR